MDSTRLPITKQFPNISLQELIESKLLIIIKTK
jgi:hypothetical protein